mgnify:CR=1 FL=1
MDPITFLIIRPRLFRVLDPGPQVEDARRRPRMVAAGAAVVRNPPRAAGAARSHAPSPWVTSRTRRRTPLVAAGPTVGPFSGWQPT